MRSRRQAEEAAANGSRRSEQWAAFAQYWRETEGARQIFPAAAELFEQGADARDVFFIERGLVKLIHREREGRELIIALRSPGWLVGAAAALIERPHAVTAVAVTACQLRRVTAEDFRLRAQTDTRFSWYLHQMHGHEVVEQCTRVAQLGCLPARLRLEQLFRQLLSAPGPLEPARNARLHLPLKHWELAELIAVTPEHLSRILTCMQREGVIRREKGWIIVPRLHRLCPPVPH